MTSKLAPYAIAALLGFVAALALFGGNTRERVRAYDRIVVRQRTDTVRDTVRVRISPVQIAGRASRTVFMKNKRRTTLDTLVMDTSTASIDTLHIEYCEPEQTFGLSLRFAPRRAPIAIPITLHDTVIEHTESTAQDRSRTWYEEVLMLLGAVAAGYLLKSVP
jgi:hypothetical protein